VQTTETIGPSPLLGKTGKRPRRRGAKCHNEFSKFPQAGPAPYRRFSAKLVGCVKEESCQSGSPPPTGRSASRDWIKVKKLRGRAMSECGPGARPPFGHAGYEIKRRN
jgi:hypothetical protein